MGDYAAYQAENLPMSQPDSDTEANNPSQPESDTEAGKEPMSQPESDTDSESDGEDFSDAPDMRDYISAKNQLAELNATRKDLMETMKRKRDELEDYMIGKNSKFMRNDDIIVEFKKSKKISWSEKALREHVDDEGKLDLDMYKTNQTEVVEKMTIKLN